MTHNMKRCKQERDGIVSNRYDRDILEARYNKLRFKNKSFNDKIILFHKYAYDQERFKKDFPREHAEYIKLVHKDKEDDRVIFMIWLHYFLFGDEIA